MNKNENGNNCNIPKEKTDALITPYVESDSIRLDIVD